MLSLKRFTGLVFVVAALVALSFFLNASCTKSSRIIKIGAILALSGDAAKYGQSCKNGIDLAVSMVNAHGGVQGKTIEILYEDSEAQPSKALSAFQKLVTISQVPAILGPMSSSEVLAVAPRAEREHVVVLTPTASAASISSAGDFVFRNVASDIYEGTEMAKFSRTQLNLSRAAIIYVNNDFGIGLKDAFTSCFVELGGTITNTQAFDQEATDFRSQLDKARLGAPDAFYIVGYKEMARLFRQVTEKGIHCQFLSFSMFEDPEIMKNSTQLDKGVYFTSQATGLESNDTLVTLFKEQFSARFGSDPDLFAGLSYDASNILIRAFGQGGTTSESIKKALYATRSFHGVTGNTTFDSNGDVIKPIAIKKFERGELTIVK